MVPSVQHSDRATTGVLPQTTLTAPAGPISPGDATF